MRSVIRILSYFVVVLKFKNGQIGTWNIGEKRPFISFLTILFLLRHEPTIFN
jgi:hypothetical protein